MASDEDEDKIVVLIPPSRGDYSLLRFQGDTTAGGFARGRLPPGRRPSGSR